MATFLTFVSTSIDFFLSYNTRCTSFGRCLALRLVLEIFGHGCAKHDVPEFGSDTIPSIFSSKMMLVMVSLEISKISSLLANMVESIVGAVVGGISDDDSDVQNNVCVEQNEGLENWKKKIEWAVHVDYSDCGWQHQPVSTINVKFYGSTGSIWWIPWMMKCKYLTILLSSRCFSEWKINLWKMYSTRENMKIPTEINSITSMDVYMDQLTIFTSQNNMIPWSIMTLCHLLWLKNSNKSL